MMVRTANFLYFNVSEFLSVMLQNITLFFVSNFVKKSGTENYRFSASNCPKVSTREFDDSETISI